MPSIKLMKVTTSSISIFRSPKPTNMSQDGGPLQCIFLFLKTGSRLETYYMVHQTYDKLLGKTVINTNSKMIIS